MSSNSPDEELSTMGKVTYSLSLERRQAEMKAHIKRKRRDKRGDQRIEAVVSQMYEAIGWTVLRKGWPDLFMYKEREDGKLEVKLVEVKGRGDKLRKEQKIVLSILAGLGIDCSTYYADAHREVAGAGEPLKTTCAQTVMNFSEVKPVEQRYQRTNDGGYIVPVKHVGAGYKILYPCPKCKLPRHGIEAYKEGLVCGPCAKKANGGRWVWPEHRERIPQWASENAAAGG